MMEVRRLRVKLIIARAFSISRRSRTSTSGAEAAAAGKITPPSETSIFQTSGNPDTDRGSSLCRLTKPDETELQSMLPDIYLS